jgi:hypothetical protein
MGAKTLTISMSEEDYDYLMKDDLLSPSKIFQVALNNIREQRKNFEQRIKILQIKCDRLQEELLKANETNKA